MRLRSLSPISILALSAAALVFAWPHAARADSPLEGKWSMSAMSETYTVQQWLPGCGPAPASGSAGGGGTVNVIAQGDELMIGSFRTNQCWDKMPTLNRTAHSREASGRAWRTTCATPPGDPRRALVNTSVVASSDTQMQIVETGRYEITLAEGTCIADVRRNAFLSRTLAAAPSASASAEPAPTARATPTPTPANTADCSYPGEPARLEVRPSRKLLRTGETFTFKAAVSDASGCPTSTATTWVAPAASKLTIESSGKVTVPEGAPEGTVEITVTASGKSTKVTVVVTSPARYDELLAQSGLNASGEKEEPSVAVIATSNMGGGDAQATEDDARKRKLLFIGIVSGVVILLGIVALFGVRRARKAAAMRRDVEERHDEKVAAYEARKRERETTHAAQMRAHLESVQRAKEIEAARGGEDDGPVACPTCHRVYPEGSTFCAFDGARLVAATAEESALPPAVSAVSAEAIARTRGKICPLCGSRFDGTATFCGKDGAALVLLN